MKEFDELLNEILHEDARVEVPGGIERRIALALSEERRPRLGKRRIWVESVAAAILLGLATTWAFNGFRPVVSVTHKAGSVVVPKFIPDRPTSLCFASHASQGPVFEQVHLPETRPRRKLQRKTIRLAPLQIEPLVIQPIEIASLTSSTSTGKGEVR